ncbi:hypothetical protein mRhiFer1_009212 [Rhinolophus ferrumequinum]|uniref:Uncharacterized protein n=1 Tax=Rhinolophus ferrumequinum TaxID=59479 RepID=A0A7J7S7X1_RHIFE|nr:hypothetical protein mRhiFer1_009212 [Rhinolophus ferrumequinum]
MPRIHELREINHKCLPLPTSNQRSTLQFMKRLHITHFVPTHPNLLPFSQMTLRPLQSSVPGLTHPWISRPTSFHYIIHVFPLPLPNAKWLLLWQEPSGVAGKGGALLTGAAMGIQPTRIHFVRDKLDRVSKSIGNPQLQANFVSLSTKESRLFVLFCFVCLFVWFVCLFVLKKVSLAEPHGKVVLNV